MSLHRAPGTIHLAEADEIDVAASSSWHEIVQKPMLRRDIGQTKLRITCSKLWLRVVISYARARMLTTAKQFRTSFTRASRNQDRARPGAGLHNPLRGKAFVFSRSMKWRCKCYVKAGNGSRKYQGCRWRIWSEGILEGPAMLGVVKMLHKLTFCSRLMSLETPLSTKSSSNHCSDSNTHSNDPFCRRPARFARKARARYNTRTTRSSI